ncbi:MAG: hypothetical protein AAF443_06540 [Chlamydiota bacterium]
MNSTITIRFILLLLAIALPLLSFGDGVDYPVIVDLNDPEYSNGMITTESGGVITAPEIRIQGQKICYTYKLVDGKKLHSVTAEGNLMLEKHGVIYIGDRLEFDFTTKTGMIYGGKSATNFWFVSGEVVEIKPNGNFLITKGTLTTSEDHRPYWTIQSRSMEITDHRFLEATGATTVRIDDTPIFWFPPLPYKVNLKSSSESTVSYMIGQDKGLWPFIGMRYQLYAGQNFTAVASCFLRPSKGVGGAVEAQYRSDTKRAHFLTRNYLDHDTFYRDHDPNKARTHYRFQGIYKAKSGNERTSLNMQYDYLSDKNLETDFVSPRFEFDPNKETKLTFRHAESWATFLIRGRIRLNTFQTQKQELPQSILIMKPISIGHSGIISENRFSTAYLTYTFANDLRNTRNSHSARLATQNSFYRPFYYRGLNLTPLVGFHGIFYSNNRHEKPAGQAVFQYGFNFDFKLTRRYSSYKHIIQPYLCYQGLTPPTLSPEEAYIFSIRDGYQKLNVLRSGIRQSFYFDKYPLFNPNFTIDFYTYAFFDATTFKKIIPKIGVNFTWNFPYFCFTSRVRWNSETQVLDTANLGIAWTINQYCAFKSEFRHRSRFDWRKNSPDNFVMEVTRPIDQLIESPLSDGRNSLISRLQIKIAPQWTTRIESHIGWGRKKEPSYNAIKVDLFTTISTSWQLHATLIHSPAEQNKDTRFFVRLSLGATPFSQEKARAPFFSH